MLICMVEATRIELAFTPWDVPPVVQQDVSSRNEDLMLGYMVGATRIELATSRPPDVRATAAPSPEKSNKYVNS